MCEGGVASNTHQSGGVSHSTATSAPAVEGDPSEEWGARGPGRLNSLATVVAHPGIPGGMHVA